MRTLILATRNRHKVSELQALLEGLGQCCCLEEFPEAPELIEDADTFAGNASRKAVQLANWLAAHQDWPGALVLADDSGLEVDALQGNPGVRSARFAADDLGAASNAPDQANNAKLLRLLEGVPAADRSARFRCCLALVEVPLPGSPPSVPMLFEGCCEGSIGFEPRGRQGFGYDPLFVPLGSDRTFAQLTEAEKNRISHRQAALVRLREWPGLAS
jgi:XTP/dITP diphosphohydrolase